MKLLTALKSLAEYPPAPSRVGICGHLVGASVSPVERDKFSEMVKRWPEYSGQHNYPVPGGREEYCRASWWGDMWDTETPYGAARLRLVLWAIEQLEAEPVSQIRGWESV